MNNNINWKEACLSKSDTIRDAIGNLNKTSLRIVIIVNKNIELIGVITDGDIRRGILNGANLDQNLDRVINKNQLTVIKGEKNQKILKILNDNNMFSIPIVDIEGKVCGIETTQHLMKEKTRENWVFLMAGGYGTRLEKLTKDTPKPMLEIGDKPILENILENFMAHGFYKFYISLHYMPEKFVDYFGDGSKWGITIKYIKEDTPLGTVGSLSLFPENTEHPIILMNGDILTRVNFDHLIEFHRNSDAFATMCVRQYDFQIPYGVVDVDEHNFKNILEKPSQELFVNAGIYVFNPEIIGYLEKNRPNNIPDILNKLTENKKNIKVFPIHEYWIDVGTMDSYKKAVIDISTY